jgi:hypothetical protein
MRLLFAEKGLIRFDTSEGDDRKFSSIDGKA